MPSCGRWNCTDYGGCCLKWFKSYLTDRKLVVSCKTADSGGEHTSQQYNVEFGTPQGSVLGPLIFLIFCNDLHLHLTFLSCIQFADDTTLYISHTNLNFITFALEHDLSILQDWFYTNKLTLNIGKSVAILFGKHGGKKLNVYIGKEVIPPTTWYQVPWNQDRRNSQLAGTHKCIVTQT